MPEVADGGGGGGETVSAASPEMLHQTGLKFQKASNVCADMAGDKVMQAGGEMENAVVGADWYGFDPELFSGAMEEVSHNFLGTMISAQQQFADAAMDLFQCAGDFRTADLPPSPDPYGPFLNLKAHQVVRSLVVPDADWPKGVPEDATLVGTQDGIQMYSYTNGAASGYYYVDRDKTVVFVPPSDDGASDPDSGMYPGSPQAAGQGQIWRQVYSPPTSKPKTAPTVPPLLRRPR